MKILQFKAKMKNGLLDVTFQGNQKLIEKEINYLFNECDPKGEIKQFTFSFDSKGKLIANDNGTNPFNLIVESDKAYFRPIQLEVDIDQMLTPISFNDVEEIAYIGGPQIFPAITIDTNLKSDIENSILNYDINNEISMTTPGPISSDSSIDFSIIESIESRQSVGETGPIIQENYEIVDVFYSTDRNRINLKDEPYYGSDYSVLKFGISKISIPKIHEQGETERPGFLKFLFGENEKKHFIIREINEFEFEKWKTEINNIGNKTALIVIHGYNVDFDDALFRTAQISFDIEFTGPSICYSWPSKGTVKGYFADSDKIRLTEHNLKKVIENIGKLPNIENINIIAHSMGTRAIVEVIKEFQKSGENICINQLLLAAPDINSTIFKEQILPFITNIPNNISVYASSSDLALFASETISESDRLGESGSNICVYESIETIDASMVNIGFLGHSYFAQHKIAINDIHQIMLQNKKADERNLKKLKIKNKRYWAFK